MKKLVCNSAGTTKKDYRNQLIYYYNKGIGNKSEIAGVIITDKLIATIEKRYSQLGGILPISQNAIDNKKGKKWQL